VFCPPVYDAGLAISPCGAVEVYRHTLFLEERKNPKDIIMIISREDSTLVELLV
jgi:hypothetical protein